MLHTPQYWPHLGMIPAPGAAGGDIPPSCWRLLHGLLRRWRLGRALGLLLRLLASCGLQGREAEGGSSVVEFLWVGGRREPAGPCKAREGVVEARAAGRTLRAM